MVVDINSLPVRLTIEMDDSGEYYVQSETIGSDFKDFTCRLDEDDLKKLYKKFKKLYKKCKQKNK